MGKIIIKHLAGSKANQIDSFELPLTELLFGRESHCQVRYDPNKDDLVSRNHCKITPEADGRCYLTDSGSKNGTFVNGQAVTDRRLLMHGDSVELGKNGVKFRFEVDPPPAEHPEATRLGDDMAGATRIYTGSRPDIPTQINVAQAEKTEAEPVSRPVAAFQAKSGIGQETLLREIDRAEFRSRKKMINLTAALIGLILLVGGFFFFQNSQEKAELKDSIGKMAADNDNKLAQLQANQSMSSAEIFKKYQNSTVLIDMSWKLIDTASGKQLFHKVECVEVKRGKCVLALPVYLSLDGTVEPELTDLDGLPIGASGSGSGFVVDSKGFILTNRHVAANWETAYTDLKPGLLKICQDSRCSRYGTALLKAEDLAGVSSLRRWVPAKARFKPMAGELKGRLDFLEVTFPKTGLSIPAHLARVSDQADVALIKIEIPEDLQPVDIGASDPVTAGDEITVMGYPAISPEVLVKVNSQDPFNREGQVRKIPEPTVTGGNIGKIIQGSAAQPSEGVGEYFSEFGDTYQLTVNATGSGNSGGPVFNNRGRVIGLFSSKRVEAGTSISFAVPIKYGMELMGVNKLVQ